MRHLFLPVIPLCVWAYPCCICLSACSRISIFHKSHACAHSFVAVKSRPHPAANRQLADPRTARNGEPISSTSLACDASSISSLISFRNEELSTTTAWKLASRTQLILSRRLRDNPCCFRMSFCTSCSVVMSIVACNCLTVTMATMLSRPFLSNPNTSFAIFLASFLSPLLLPWINGFNSALICFNYPTCGRPLVSGAWFPASRPKPGVPPWGTKTSGNEKCRDQGRTHKLRALDAISVANSNLALASPSSKVRSIILPQQSSQCATHLPLPLAMAVQPIHLSDVPCLAMSSLNTLETQFVAASGSGRSTSSTSSSSSTCVCSSMSSSRCASSSLMMVWIS